MLLGISPLISPELLKILAEMGHGDEIVLGDRNFPAATVANRLVRLDGHGIIPVLSAILTLFPVDDFEPDPAMGMAVIDGDGTLAPALALMQDTLRGALGEDFRVAQLARVDFYTRARSAYAVVATGESLFYGDLILRKGVVAQEASQ
ncbi:MAG: ribose ABC transporter [Mesorhizobium sp.]|nr:RbsD/FucU domain-containing protein [Mesorhizobium sp.]MBL8579098.1 ribose ABC transporter [Mesorhizobium sp.]